MNYELTLTTRSKDTAPFSVERFDKIIADSLVSLLSQFIVLVAALHRGELEEQGRTVTDDDVPF